MKHKHKRLTFIVLLISSLIILLTIFTFKAYAPENGFVPSGDVIVIRSLTGGLCSDGKVCHGEAKLYANGYFNDKRIDQEKVSKLQKLIAENKFDYDKNPDPDCPSLVDGSDIGYAFPGKTGETIFTLCMLDIPKDDPLFSYLSSLNL